MKKIHMLVIAALSAFLPGCQTPTQTQAIATAEAGNAVSTYVLAHNGPTSIKGLQDLATALPQIPYGKVTPTQLGAISAELQGIQAQLKATSATSAQSQLLNQVGSLIALVSQASTVGGDAPTAEQGLLSANCADVALGISNAIQFYMGQHGLTTAP